MKRILIILISVVLFLQISYPANSQDSLSVYPDFPSTISKKRIYPVAGLEGLVLTGSIAGLYSIWYKDMEHTKFHFFNDNGEWMMMDKAGHFAGSYHIARLSHLSARWAGMSNKNAVLYGSLISFTFMSCIEVFDGIAADYGASVGDLVANTSGILLFAAQELIWNDQRIGLKYSWHPSIYAQYRPKLLGNNPIQQAVKDYNGITIWASANPSSFGMSDSFPKWLNIAIGYGVEGMTGAFDNPEYVDGKYIPHFVRRKQFYLSLDLDLKRIPTKSKTLKYVFHALNFIKVPMPALEYDAKEGWRLWPVYF